MAMITVNQILKLELLEKVRTNVYHRFIPGLKDGRIEVPQPLNILTSWILVYPVTESSIFTR